MSIDTSRFILTESGQAALEERAEKYQVAVEVLYEVFNRGLVAWTPDSNKTIEQYAFNRVDSFLAGGLASKLDKDLHEISSDKLGSYILKAKQHKANLEKDSNNDSGSPMSFKSLFGKVDNYHKMAKRDAGIAKATAKLTQRSMKEEVEQVDELSKSTLARYVRKARGDIRKHADHVDHPNDSEDAIVHDTKAFKRQLYTKAAQAKISEEEQIDELSADTLTSYAIKASAQRPTNFAKIRSHVEFGKMARTHKNDKQVNHHERKIKEIGKKNINRTHGLRKALNKIATKSMPVSAHEEVIVEKAVDQDPLKYITVNQRVTGQSGVRQKHNQREKDMYNTIRTNQIPNRSFGRSKTGTGHLTDKKGTELTDRITTAKRDRLQRLKSQIIKSKNIGEGTHYIDARIKLHDAHHEAGRMLSGMERDPELRRLDRHRAKKHRHASIVLQALKDKKSKK